MEGQEEPQSVEMFTLLHGAASPPSPPATDYSVVYHRGDAVPYSTERCQWFTGGLETGAPQRGEVRTISKAPE